MLLPRLLPDGKKRFAPNGIKMTGVLWKYYEMPDRSFGGNSCGWQRREAAKRLPGVFCQAAP